ncbi:MAG: hypothetical protein COB04_02255 [Gammaproteobacteria bacterium]|nr:MAG: hypothetical protein COB04_02255 [Gammaproteobacteria bacterium]
MSIEFGSIHNYYERQVLEAVRSTVVAGTDDDSIADIACVALNHLPPRYIRHDVDMRFYLSPEERMEIDRKVMRAVEDAIKFVVSADP